MGTAEEAEGALDQWLHHDEKPKEAIEVKAEEAVDRALIQGIYFETPSLEIFGVREHRFDSDAPLDGGGVPYRGAWDRHKYSRWASAREAGIDGDFEPSEKILGPALMRMRVAFSDNARGKELRHLKGGKVDPRVLGRRAFHGDERLFRRRQLPGKKNYFVLIGMDVSGSTMGTNLLLEKQAVMAQAKLLSRMGIQFSIYAHSGGWHDMSDMGVGMDLDIYLVKGPDEPFTTKIEERLTSLGPDSGNLDGHTLEYYRKVLDKVEATDKIILYYTDGKMPASNHDEELEILQREIRTCKRKGYTLLGVGINTDSPTQHGLETVQVDGEEDVVKVVKHIEKRLLSR